MFDFQADVIFPIHAVGQAAPLPATAERLTLKTSDSHTLHGVIIPPARAKGARRTLILGFAGNAWNTEDALGYLHRLYPEAHVAGFHYRGYRPSTGRPSAEALFDDAPLTHDLLRERVKPDRIIAVGFSIGTGVAAHLASRRALDGLVLVTPFDSLKAVAADLYPMVPVGLLFRHEMNSITALKSAEVPVAILAAERDSIIPPQRTEALRRTVADLRYDRTISGAGHNDIYQRPDFQAAMREALEALD